jgi:hypothetical protein
MKHRELTDHIQGSFLKKQYLEAFLVQSAYIESLLKLYVDFSLYNLVGDKHFEDKVSLSMRKKFDKFNLNDLIKFLYDAEKISKQQRDALNMYRENRNRILHYIIQEIGKDGFEESLKEICILGNEIIGGQEFIRMATIIDNIETPKPPEADPSKGDEDDHTTNSLQPALISNKEVEKQ